MNEKENKKSFLSIFDEMSPAKKGQNGHHYPGIPEEDEEFIDEFALTEELDHEILMNRDAHFGGDFETMLQYYQNEDAVGVNPDFPLDRIAYLAEIEKETGDNLASTMLAGYEMERVAAARQAYQKLKEIYNLSEEKNPIPRLLADLVLSEEEEPENEIEAIVSQGTRIVPELISLVKTEEMYDPLFPGYGYAPYLAIVCLGRIGDARAVTPLFETLGKEMIFDEEIILEALLELGDPAQEFLTKVLKSRPLTNDNVNAAFALIAFGEDPEVAAICFEQLRDKEVQKNSFLRAYLINNCDALKETPMQAEVIKMSKDTSTPPELRQELGQLIRHWEE